MFWRIFYFFQNNYIQLNVQTKDYYKTSIKNDNKSIVELRKVFFKKVQYYRILTKNNHKIGIHHTNIYTANKEYNHLAGVKYQHKVLYRHFLIGIAKG